MPCICIGFHLVDTTSATTLLPNRFTKRSTATNSLPELKLILEHASKEWQGIILTGLYTGQRLTAHRDDENAAVVNTLLRNYAPRSAFVAEFWDNKFSVSDLSAIAETSRNVRKKQEITASDEEIIAQADCSMMEFRIRLKEK